MQAGSTNRSVRRRVCWKRFLFVAFVAGAIMGVSPLYMGLAEGRGQPAYAEVTIRRGETLWGIASAYATPETDVRRLVHEIVRLNDLDGALIRPGQVLRVPVAPAGERELLARR